MPGSAEAEKSVPCVVAFVTCANGKSREIARTLVEEKLVACVNIIPTVTSIYFWDNAVQEDSEELMVLKTTADAWHKLQARIKSLHPYDLPEMIYFPIQGGYEPYLNWLRSSITGRETVGG
ncbi:MAG: divalent-cation tolerance protein CutA [Candidatus Obscuribacterales bacterium]|nr:divalent-cation tolerance protein CutA [Candidatus Obscuribacterales bacterium]